LRKHLKSDVVQNMRASMLLHYRLLVLKGR